MKFSEQEKLEYSKMEAAALTTYVNLKGQGGRIGKHHFNIMGELTPLRIACAGGKVPKISNFAFTSKLEALISELEIIRERDATGKCFPLQPRCHLFCHLTGLVLLLSQPNALFFHNSRRHWIG